jgi:hypothetical protein
VSKRRQLCPSVHADMEALERGRHVRRLREITRQRYARKGGVAQFAILGWGDPRDALDQLALCASAELPGVELPFSFLMRGLDTFSSMKQDLGRLWDEGSTALVRPLLEATSARYLDLMVEGGRAGAGAEPESSSM